MSEANKRWGGGANCFVLGLKCFKNFAIFSLNSVVPYYTTLLLKSVGRGQTILYHPTFEGGGGGGGGMAPCPLFRHH